jgi:hypothetical protein
VKNDYKSIIRDGLLLEIISDLTDQAGGSPPTMRSCYYVLRDNGHIIETKNAYDKLNKSLTQERDAGRFPYGLLAPEGGEFVRGIPLDLLEEKLERIRHSNISPELIDGVLKAVLVEKIGLVDTIRRAVNGMIPVASPGGMIRKEWAWNWLRDLEWLADHLGATSIEIVYLGDYDDGGNNIRENLYWYEGMGNVTIDYYAVTNEQIAMTGFDELHIDGYIASVRGPKVFGFELRQHLGLSDV